MLLQLQELGEWRKMKGRGIRFAELFRKELLQVLRDPKVRFAVFAPSFLLLLTFGYGGITTLREASFAVLDCAHTAQTEAITAKLDASTIFNRKRDFQDYADLRRRIETKDVKLAVVFPTDFSRSHEVNLIADGRTAIAAQKALSHAEEIIASQFKYGGLRISSRGWFNPGFDDIWFMPPNMLAILMLLVLMLLVSLVMTQERETGTLDQLRITPYTPFEILLAKGCCGMTVGLLQFVMSLVLIFCWFRVPFTGSIFALGVMGISFTVTAVGLGLLVSIWCRNLQQAMIATVVVMVPLVHLSGMLTPVSCMPDALQAAMAFNPAQCAVSSLQRLFLEGAGLMDVWREAAYLFALGIGLFALAWYGFKRK